MQQYSLPFPKKEEYKKKPSSTRDCQNIIRIRNFDLEKRIMEKDFGSFDASTLWQSSKLENRLKKKKDGYLIDWNLSLTKAQANYLNEYRGSEPYSSIDMLQLRLDIKENRFVKKHEYTAHDDLEAWYFSFVDTLFRQQLHHKIKSINEDCLEVKKEVLNSPAILEELGRKAGAVIEKTYPSEDISLVNEVRELVKKDAETMKTKETMKAILEKLEESINK
jgi:hypothetical protein